MKITSTAALLIVSVTCLVVAQAEKKTLTNPDVVRLLKGGVPEDTVVLMIQNSPARYDTTPDAVLELTKAGVTGKVLDAMVKAQQGTTTAPGSNAPGASPIPATAFPQHSRFRSAMLLNGTNKIEIKQSQAQYDSTVVPFFGKAVRFFQGKNALLRITNDLPVFEVALMANHIPSEILTLHKPTVKKDKREIFLQGVAGPGVKIKPDKKKDTVPLTIEEAGKENTPGVALALYRVRPASPLQGGEYVLEVFHSFYSFGVDR